MNRFLRLVLPAALGVVVLALSACGGHTVTRPRLERSLERSFANNYTKQAALLGHQGVSPRSLHPHAFCDKGGPQVADQGPGADWNCYMSFTDRNVPLTDGTAKFEMNVHSNGCYTAGGSTKVFGQLTLTDTRGQIVDNPVFEFDGCFDPTGSNAPNHVAGTPAAVSLPSGKVPIDAGTVAPELACSTGAPGGCVGTVTAKVGSRTVASVVYQLPPGGSNAVSFPVAGSDRRLGTKVDLAVTPFVGGAAGKTRATVTLSPPPPEG
jgi:hypothetical protein